MGQPIIRHQGLGFLLAEMQTRTDASRAILYQGARCLDEGLPLGTISSSSKNFVANSTVQTVIDAMEVFGGYGYVKIIRLKNQSEMQKSLQFSMVQQKLTRWLSQDSLRKNINKEKG